MTSGATLSSCFPLKLYASGGGRDEARYGPQQRRLSGAVCSEDRDHFPGVDFKGYVPKGLERSVACLYSVNAKQHVAPPGKPRSPALLFATSAGVPFGDVGAVIENDDAVRHAHHHAHLVLDEADRDARLLDLS